jgi:hypothetical protein
MQLEADVLRNRMVVVIVEVFGGTFKKEGTLEKTAARLRR